MAKKDKITVKKLDDVKKSKKGGEEKEAKTAKVLHATMLNSHACAVALL